MQANLPVLPTLRMLQYKILGKHSGPFMLYHSYTAMNRGPEAYISSCELTIVSFVDICFMILSPVVVKG